MLISYSKPAYSEQYVVARYSLSYLSRLKIAEWAATFAARNYTSVWLVPGTGED